LSLDITTQVRTNISSQTLANINTIRIASIFPLINAQEDFCKISKFLTEFQVSIRDAEQLDLLASLVVEGHTVHVGAKFCRTS